METTLFFPCIDVKPYRANKKYGWCSTPILLLVGSSFTKENGHPSLICSSLSTAWWLNLWMFKRQTSMSPWIGRCFQQPRMWTVQSYRIQLEYYDDGYFPKKYILRHFKLKRILSWSIGYQYKDVKRETTTIPILSSSSSSSSSFLCKPPHDMCSARSRMGSPGDVYVNDSTKMPQKQVPVFVVTTEKPWKNKRSSRLLIIDWESSGAFRMVCNCKAWNKQVSISL